MFLHTIKQFWSLRYKPDDTNCNMSETLSYQIYWMQSIPEEDFKYRMDSCRASQIINHWLHQQQNDNNMMEVGTIEEDKP